MSSPFTENQRKTVRKIFDSFTNEVDESLFPACDQSVKDMIKRKCSDLNVDKQFETMTIARLPEFKAKEIKNLLDLLSTKAGCFSLCGYFKPFYELTLTEAENAMKSWSTSPIFVKRKAFMTFKLISCCLYLLITETTGGNPNWEALKYVGPDPETLNVDDSQDFKFEFEDHSKFPARIECDAVVIGSGAGGGVAAAQLTAAGYKVIVVEKGDMVARKDIEHIEFRDMERTYENGSSIFCEDSPMTVFSGATFGGGTAINWAASFRTPKKVLEEWANKYGLKQFLSDEFQQSLDHVLKVGGVHSEVEHNSQNKMFKEACEKLNYHHGVIPHNAEGPHSCGWCGMGCKRGLKNSVHRTFLKDAALTNNCTFITKCTAENIITMDGKAHGVLCRLSTNKKIFISSKVTVVACGSIHSPSLLMRSNIKNNKIGKNLRLHPVSCVCGVFEKPVNAYQGGIMTWYSDEVANRDGSFYGAKLETPSPHPGVFGMSVGWTSAFQFKYMASKFSHCAFGIALVRDKGHGQVKNDKNGNPLLYYKLSDFDSESMNLGLELVIKMLVASGAKEISCGVSGVENLIVENQNVNDPKVKDFIKKMRENSKREYTRPLFSAHQMGTCQMGTSPDNSVVNPDGESWQVKNLFVVDASTFPSPSGSNPMMTIEAMSHFLSKRIIKRLDGIKSQTESMKAKL